MRLEDLNKKSISSMTKQEALSLIISIRNSRSRPTAASQKRSEKIAKAAKAQAAPNQLSFFDSMSPDQQAAFIKAMEARRNASNSPSSSEDV
jgi:hypothetical protein